MKIATYEVPCTVTRDSLGNVHVQMHDDQKVRKSSEEVTFASNEILMKTNEIARFNDDEIQTAHAILSSAENKRECKLEIKFLEG